MTSVKKNYIFTLLYQMFLVVVPLIVTPYVSRVLTPSGVGQISYTQSTITYFTMIASLGFTLYSQREIAKNQGDKYKQTLIFWETNICRSLSVLVSLVICLILCSINVFGGYTNIMYIMTINVLAIMFDISFLYQGNENFKKIVLRNFVIKTISIILIFLLVKKESDIWIYALINSSMVVISNLSLWLTVKKDLVKVNLKDIKPFHNLKSVLTLFVPTLATTIYVIINKTLMGVLIRDTVTVIVDGVEITKKYADIENGFYDSSDKLVKLALTLITSLGTVMISRNSAEFEKGNNEVAINNFYKSSSFMLMVAIPMTLGLISIAFNIVPWFYGQEYSKVSVLLIIESVLFVVIGLSNLYANLYLAPLGKDKQLGIISICTLIIQVVLSLIMIPLYWSVGAMIATLVSETFTTIAFIFVSRKEISFLKCLQKARKYLAAGIIMFSVTMPLGYFLTPNFGFTLLIIIVGAFVYLCSLLLFKDQFLLSLLNSFLSNIKSKIKR